MEKSSAHVVLPPDGHGGDHATQPFGTGRQQEIPGEGVDGGTSGECVAVVVAIDGGQGGQVGQQQQQGGRRVERLGQARRRP